MNLKPKLIIFRIIDISRLQWNSITKNWYFDGVYLSHLQSEDKKEVGINFLIDMILILHGRYWIPSINARNLIFGQKIHKCERFKKFYQRCEYNSIFCNT